MKLLSNRRYEYLLAWMIPALVLTSAFALRGIYPFGSTSVLLWDMNIQYVGYFGWLSDVLHGSGNLLYSFSQGMGEGTTALLSYYLTSPFNLLLIFFDSSHIPQFLSWLTLVKLPFAGVSCYIFLRKRYGTGNIYLLFACAYALCGYVVAQCSNIMWMDGVIMLPLVALGVWLLVHTQRLFPLFLSIVCTIVFNWYTGYMNCLFALLYFLFCSFVKGREPHFLRRFGRFVAVMLLGVGASMFLFLPSVFGLLQGEGSTFKISDLITPYVLNSPLSFFNYLIVTATQSDSEDKRPLVYISALVLIPVVAFFRCTDVPKRRRIAYALLISTTLIGVFLTPVATIWSSLKLATSYYGRHLFILAFMTVMVAAEGIKVLETLAAPRRRRLLYSSAFLLAILMVLSVVNVWFYKRTFEVSYAAFAVEMAMLFGYATLLNLTLTPSSETDKEAGIVVSKNDKTTRLTKVLHSKAAVGACALIMMGALVIEQTYNAESVFSHYTTDVNAFGSYVDTMEAVYSSLDSNDGSTGVGVAGFSYLGNLAYCTSSENFVLGVRNIAEYSSTMNGKMSKLLSALGYSSKNEIFGTYYNSPMLVTDSLLGINYVISATQPAGTTQVQTSSLPYAGYSVWRYDDALPLGYGISSKAGKVSWTKDPFENQEKLLSNMTDSDASDLYTSATVTDESSDSSTRSFSVTINQTGAAYLYTYALDSVAESTDSSAQADVYVNGTLVQNVGGRFTNNVIYLGAYDQGTTLEVKLVLKTPTAVSNHKTKETASELLASSSIDDLVRVESLSSETFNELRSQLDSSGFTMDSFEDGKVSCTFDASSDETLLLNIPYDQGWSATVDGQSADIVELYDGLIGIELSAGQHQIILSYTPRGLIAGIVISLASVAIFIAWQIMCRRPKIESKD
jgi:uncharacterized membrane protein YfhO